MRAPLRYGVVFFYVLLNKSSISITNKEHLPRAISEEWFRET